MFHNRKHLLDWVRPRSTPRNEKQFWPERIRRSSVASGMVKHYVVQQKDVTRRQGKDFNNLANTVLLYEPSLRAN